MNDPFEALDWLHPSRSGDSFEPTAEEIDKRLSGAGTYLLAVNKADIEALCAGRMLGFYLEDMQNILVRYADDDLIVPSPRVSSSVSTEGAAWAMDEVTP